jgi:hypothetical protein
LSFVLFVYQLFHQHDLDGKMPFSWSYEIAPQYYALSTIDLHNIFYAAYSSIICTSLRASIGPCSLDVWDDVIGLYCYDMWDLLTLKDSMVTPIPILSS